MLGPVVVVVIVFGSICAESSVVVQAGAAAEAPGAAVGVAGVVKLGSCLILCMPMHLLSAGHGPVVATLGLIGFSRSIGLHCTPAATCSSLNSQMPCSTSHFRQHHNRGVYSVTVAGLNQPISTSIWMRGMIYRDDLLRPLSSHVTLCFLSLEYRSMACRSG